MKNSTRVRIDRIDHWLVSRFKRHGHRVHRISLGALFVWFGLLKPFGMKTTTSLLAHTIYWGSPEVMVPILGWWEVAIGVCLMIRPWVRGALLLLVIRLPATVLALIVHPEICWVHFPLSPTPEGQYLLKDVTLFFAALAIAGAAREPSTPEQHH